MNDIKIFENLQFGKLRGIMRDNEPWFVAADVCRALKHSNVTMALDQLDEDERAKLNLGRQGEVNIISEGGLWSLVLGSRKPEAKAYKRWITHDVTPTLRKTGTYTMPTASTAPTVPTVPTAPTVPTVPTVPPAPKSPYNEAVLLNARTRQAELIAKLAADKRLPPEMVQRLTAEAVYIATNRSIWGLPAPALIATVPAIVPTIAPPPVVRAPTAPPQPQQPKPQGRTWTATEIAAIAGTAKHIVGMTADKHGIKTPEYGYFKTVRDKFRGGTAEQFMYSERGKDKMLELLKAQ